MKTISNGNFADFGGIYLPPELKKILENLAARYFKLSQTEKFKTELKQLYRDYANRPSLLYFAQNLSQEIGCKIYLKREDLNHTGAHKINNALGQALLARSMGKKKLIAETGAGQHGVATATVAAYFGMDCDIYMGRRDIEAQKPNVYRMKVLGAKLIAVEQGQGTLKDAVDLALKNYVKEAATTHYLLGSAVGPHPYPSMVRDFQKIIGEEIEAQILKQEQRLPTKIIACVGGGSNAIGAFYNFLEKKTVELIAVEPAGKGRLSGQHGMSLGTGKPGVIHGFRTLLMTNKEGKTVEESYSIASGLDYPGVGPELSMLKENGRLTVAAATDQEALAAFARLSRLEGIIPALESAHAIAYLFQKSSKFKKDDLIVLNLSGRGDKDVENIYSMLDHA